MRGGGYRSQVSRGSGGRGRGGRGSGKGRTNSGRSAGDPCSEAQLTRQKDDVDEDEEESNEEEEVSSGSDSEGQENVEVTKENQVKLFLFEFKQNDSKVDSGVRLTRRGIAKTLRPQASFHGIVLSPLSNIPISPADRDTLLNYGLAGVNCSWNRIDDLPWPMLKKRGQHRVLPWLLASNAINYGRPFKLNTAEAMAATLLIAGLKEAATPILRAFSWGDEFLKINSDEFDAYSSAADGAGVRVREAELRRRRDDERARRKADNSMDLPPSCSGSSGNSESGDDAEETAEVEDCKISSPLAGGSVTEPSVSDSVKKVGESPQATMSTVTTAVEHAAVAPSAAQVDLPQRKGKAEATTRETPATKAGIITADVDTSARTLGKDDSIEAVVEMPPAISSDAPAPPPRLQKAVLVALQAATSEEFQLSVGLAGLSGNVLAKMRRADFEAIWKQFCREEVPLLSSSKVAAVIAVADGNAAAAVPKAGRQGKR
eukprot:TRINITY_DN57246_c0_g1_i1.p1 TRINITY_DN57246_c0_g1~~TRINITY_DN57246_c0_g1_i1.p1  ORF type:complete len:488 (+),score=110.54 TRINITY_DN57246_c0_g1_i1:78-1541(+)